MENVSLDIDISEKCGFCMKSFTCLRPFVLHLDKYCLVKKKLEGNGSRLNEEQHITMRRRNKWLKRSNMELNQQRAIIKGTISEECSVAGNTRSYSNTMIRAGNKEATPELLALRSRDGGEGDEGSTKLGS